MPIVVYRRFADDQDILKMAAHCTADSACTLELPSAVYPGIAMKRNIFLTTGIVFNCHVVSIPLAIPISMTTTMAFANKSGNRYLGNDKRGIRHGL